MVTQFGLPEISHICFTAVFEGFLARGVPEEGKRVGQAVLVADVPDAREPVLAALAGASEHLDSNIVKNIATEMANHPEKSELLQMEESLTRQTPGQEEYHRFWSFRVEF